MKTGMDNLGKSTSENKPTASRDTKDDKVIKHETIPGEKSHRVAQDQKRTVENSGSALSTTDDDLN